MKKWAAFLTLLAMAALFTACGRGDEQYYAQDLPPSTGRIFLYGEHHGCAATMARQLEIWGNYYTNHGMRHLFIETAYFTAQFLNQWMQTDDDVLLYKLFDEWRGTAKHVPAALHFYRTIRQYYPETIFHGTDVGHQYYSTGQRFLAYLIENNLQDTESYRLTRENIAQFYHFITVYTHAIRAYYKPQNFIREFDRLGNQDVMAIHGMAHVELGHNFFIYRGVTTMAQTLYERYGDALYTFDMTHYFRGTRPTSPGVLAAPIRVDIITVNGIDFEATYYGNDNLWNVNFHGRQFWRLENAYEYFRDSPLTGNVLPFSNFPMLVEVGQVFIVDIHLHDGTVLRQFYRASGYYFGVRPTTQEFLP